MKVLHAINYLSDGGGAEKLMEDLLPAIKSRGVDVSVAVLRDIDTENSRYLRSQGIEIINIGGGESLYGIRKMLKLLPVMKKFDIVHTHLTAPFLYGAFNKAFCKARFVHTVHNTDSKMRHSAVLKHLERWAIRRYDSVITCSQEAEDSLRLFIGETNDNILTINNGVRLSKIFNAKPIVSLKKCEEEKIILMVAVFRAQKNQETLIRATKLLPDNFQTYFVGYGGLLDQMEALSRQLGLEKRVHFLGKRTDVPTLLKTADFIVLSSHFEGLSLSSIEGMAAGKPFIASDVPGLHEMVSGYGELFEDGNAQQLADIILRLANEPQEYNEVANRCLERAKEFDIDKMADGYISVYKSLIS